MCMGESASLNTILILNSLRKINKRNDENEREREKKRARNNGYEEKLIVSG